MKKQPAEMVETAELAHVLRLHPQTVRNLAPQGRIPAVRLAGFASPLRFGVELVKNALAIEIGDRAEHAIKLTEAYLDGNLERLPTKAALRSRSSSSAAGGRAAAVQRTATEKKPEPEMVETAKPARGCLVTTTELAQVLGVHPQTVFKLAREGRIPAMRLRAHYRFDIDAVKAALTVTAAASGGV